MSTNSLTLGAVLDRRRLTGAPIANRFTRDYLRAVKRATRHMIYGDDTRAADSYAEARRFAHYAADHGDREPLIDVLSRAVLDTDDADA